MRLIKIAICISIFTFSSVAIAQEKSTPAPVSKALEGWSAEETLDNIRNFSVSDLIITSERALWYHRNASQTNKTAILVRRQSIMELPSAILREIGSIRAETALGSMTLDEFMASPESYAQGLVVVHKGKIAYETYPGMHELDPHFTASVSKILGSLVIDLLIDDGLIDERKSLGNYVPEFVGSAWENVPVRDALDMTVGLNVSEYDRTSDISIISRLMAAELGEPINGKLENMLDVMLDAQPQ